MNILSLFDGISCGRIAMERANIKVDRYVAYEIDNYAIQVSKNNYPDIEHCGDVTTADFTKYKGFDLLIGGSPCVYWSISRSTLSNHKRETTCSGIGWELFMQFKRALLESECKYFLYENNASISKEIKQKISEELGIDCVLINSNLFSAQNRKRCYWTNIPILPIKDLQISFQDIKETDNSVLKNYKVKQTPSRIRMWNNGLGRINGALCCDNITHKDKTGTVTSKQDRNYNAGLIEYEDFCRYLTLEEQEKLQTLPVGYTRGVPASQRSKCIGNGWTVDVISHIFKGI